MDFNLEEQFGKIEKKIEERFELFEDELANFMEILRIVSGDNQKLAVRVRDLFVEDERLSDLTADHEKRISELEEGFLFEN